MKDTYLALVVALAIWVSLGISALTPNYDAVASTDNIRCPVSNVTIGPSDIPPEAPSGVKKLMVRMDKIDARSKALVKKLSDEK